MIKFSLTGCLFVLSRPTLLPMVQSGKIDSTLPITHVLPLSEAPRAYKIFDDKEDGCVKVCVTHPVVDEAWNACILLYRASFWGFFCSGRFLGQLNKCWKHVLLSCCVQVLLKPGMDRGKVTDRGESVTESVCNTVSGVAKGALGSTL